MLGVDRLDMIKGIPQKLLAFEEFLEEHPEWRDKVLLVQIAVPSRTDVPEYQASPILCFNACTRRRLLLVQVWLARSKSLTCNCRCLLHWSIYHFQGQHATVDNVHCLVA